MPDESTLIEPAMRSATVLVCSLPRGLRTDAVACSDNVRAIKGSIIEYALILGQGMTCVVEGVALRAAVIQIAER